MDSISADEVQRYGYTVSSPATHYEQYENPRSHTISLVPEGVHPSFAYRPGQAQAAVEAALKEKLATTAPDIAKAIEKISVPVPAASSRPSAWRAR
jgi:hypothetical protein